MHEKNSSVSRAELGEEVLNTQQMVSRPKTNTSSMFCLFLEKCICEELFALKPNHPLGKIVFIAFPPVEKNSGHLHEGPGFEPPRNSVLSCQTMTLKYVTLEAVIYICKGATL